MIASKPPDADNKGPVFLKEPINRIDFSNSTGAVVECRASGNPQPEIIWVRSDGTAVGDVPGLRQVLSNGNLVFPPFQAEDYRQEVHAQVYACLAKNQFGSIISRDVHVRAGRLHFLVFPLFLVLLLIPCSSFWNDVPLWALISVDSVIRWWTFIRPIWVFDANEFVMMGHLIRKCEILPPKYIAIIEFQENKGLFSGFENGNQRISSGCFVVVEKKMFWVLIWNEEFCPSELEERSW